MKSQRGVLIALLLVALLGSAAGTRGHLPLRRGLKAVDENSSCVVQRVQYSYKPRGGGNWEDKHSGLDTCFDECGDEYDFLVHNTRTDSCYCWRAQDGQLEYTGGNDDTFDLTACRNTRAASDDDDSSSSSSNGNPRAGGGDVEPAKCTRKFSEYTYKPRNGGNWQRKYEDLDDCLRQCRDGYEIIVHNRNSGSCYCWRLEDGEFQPSTGADQTYYIGNCYVGGPGGSTRAGEDELPPVGYSFSADELEYCIEEEYEPWTIFGDYACTGSFHFVVRPNYLVEEIDPYDSEEAGNVGEFYYDGSVEMCQTIFSLDYWNALKDEAIRVRSESWYTHSVRTGECWLYTDDSDCNRLTFVGANSGMESGRYCNDWTRK